MPYDSDLGWASESPAGGASAIDDLSDVDTDKSKTPADGDALTFDGTVWNAEAGVTTLAGLTDVDTTDLADWDVLRRRSIGDPIEVAYSSAGYNGLLDYCRDNAISPTFTSSGAAKADKVFNEQSTTAESYEGGNGAGQWVKCDMGAGYLIDPTHMGIRTRTDNGTYLPKNFKFQVSANDEDWTDVYSTTVGMTQGAWRVSTVAPVGWYRYFRVFATGVDTNNGPYMIISNLEIWGELVEVLAVPDFTFDQPTIDDLSDVDTDKSKTPAIGDHLTFDGTVWNAGAGGPIELAYVEFTADAAPTATTEGTANAVVSAGSVAFDGSTTVMVEFFAPHVSPTGATGAFVVLVLYDGASSIGLLSVIRVDATANDDVKPVHVVRRLTPSNASHTYSVRAYVSGGTGEVIGGVGGAGNIVPGFIRISTVPSPV